MAKFEITKHKPISKWVNEFIAFCPINFRERIPNNEISENLNILNCHFEDFSYTARNAKKQLRNTHFKKVEDNSFEITTARDNPCLTIKIIETSDIYEYKVLKQEPHVTFIGVFEDGERIETYMRWGTYNEGEDVKEYLMNNNDLKMKIWP